MTLKELKTLVKLGIATDITNEDITEFGSYEVLAVSHGINGNNGCLIRNVKTGELFVILARNSLLDMLV